MNQAIVLCAGAGSRFWPYNEVRNKCATPVVNEPAVRRLVRQIREAGIRRAVVVLGVHPGSIRSALHGVDGLEIAFVGVQGVPGTAACVHAALPLLDTSQRFAVFYGDVVTTQATVNRFLQPLRIATQRRSRWFSRLPRPSGRLTGWARTCSRSASNMWRDTAATANTGYVASMPSRHLPFLPSRTIRAL